MSIAEQLQAEDEDDDLDPWGALDDLVMDFIEDVIEGAYE